MRLLVIDGNSIANRAFYGIKLLTTKDGRYTNAIYGFLNILLSLLKECQPDEVAVAFDLKAPTFRHKMYDGYKATRHAMPEELAQQMPVLKQLLADLGYRTVTAEGWEADDILGTLAAACAARKDDCFLATGDRDSLQLVSESTTVLLAATVMGRSKTVAMDEDACAVYSLGGTRLASIQSGYARPALAAGKTRFVLYNRSGNELRVESRTQNLYSKTLENSIYLCAMSDTGTLAVATDSADSTARLTVYTSTMTEQLHWDMTGTQGTPVRMAFAADSRRLAVAAVTSSAGQLQANLFALSLAQGDPVQLSSGDSVPQWLGWLNNDTVLAVYENCAVVYGADGGERGRFDLGGGSLVSVSQDGANAALLLENGQVCTAVLLDKDLNVQYSGNVPAANQILRRGQNFYLLTDSGVECFATDGVYQWGQELSVRPQALIAGKQLLVLCGNTVQQIAPPEQTASSAR